MKFRLLLAISVAILVIAPRVRAQSADALKKAQTSFDEAQVAYVAGKYDEAAKGFQDAYAARPFPQFLYNVAASFHMKGKKGSDVEAYKKAVEFYTKYLAEEPAATDKAKVEKTIGVLQAEIKRLQEPPVGVGSGSGSAAPPQAPSQDVENLGDVKVRGLVVIITEPQNATVYLDDPKSKPLATTPWSGSIEGEHKLYIEKKGFRPVDTTISADPSKLVQVIVPMSQDSTFAWLDVTSNVEGANVYVDDKTVAPFKAPLGKNVTPGHHTIWVSAEGYDEYKIEVDIPAGDTKSIKAPLKGSPVGRLDVVGTSIEDAMVLVDGKVLCEHGPCVRNLTEGDHTVTVTRDGYKTYSKHIAVQAKSDTVVRVTLVKAPGHGDAIAAGVFAVVFFGGGVYAGLQANSIHDDLTKAINAGMPPVDSNDPRFLKGKVYSIVADAAYGVGTIAALTAVYYALRDSGPDSAATIDMRSIALRPEVNSSYAGVGMEVHW